MFIQIFFGYCALMITLSGILAISLRNPVHCVLMVLALFFHMAGLYLTLNAEFLAAVQIIVYAGAILVLYLFVLFLVSLREELHLDAFIANPWVGRVIAAGLAAALLYVIPTFTPGAKGGWSVEAIKQVTHTKARCGNCFARRRGFSSSTSKIIKLGSGGQTPSGSIPAPG